MKIGNLVEDLKQIIEALLLAGRLVRGILLNVAEFELMQQPGMSKAKACKMLGYSPATINNRLRDAGLEHLVAIPTRGATTKGIRKMPRL